MEKSDARIVFMTAPSAGIASDIVRTLVEEGVIACGNIVPGVTSIYEWQGALEQTAEALVVMKTVVGRLEQLEQRVNALHPYDVPELLAVAVSEGNPPYLAWLVGNASAGVQEERQDVP